MKTILWHGCYDGSWKTLITDESFSHPAKFAPGLIKRIYAHGLAKGYWRKGDLIGDPFGGIAGGGIMAGYAGLNWVGVELESRFVALGNANTALHAPSWLGLGEVSCVKLLQGDSREFARIVGEAAGVVTSPPYGETLNHGSGPETAEDKRKGLVGFKNGYGSTPGQIDSLPTGTIDGAVMSPPFAECRTDGAGIAIDGKTTTSKMGRSSLAAVITSPPYAESIKGDHKERETAAESHAARSDPGQGGSLGKSQRFGGYGATAGNIGNLKEGKVDAVVTSPPFTDRNACNDPNFATGRVNGGGKLHADYGRSDGQIGIVTGETYWQAMALVYRQCHLALRPGGYMAIVVKDYVKDKARVPLCDQTLQLLTSLGFEPVERIHAMLVKETTREGLWETTTKKTERKSFFRRLAEKKGSPAIDYEEVLIVRSIP